MYLSIIKAPQKRERWDVVEAVNVQLRQLANDLHGFRYIDVNPVFFGRDAQPRMDFHVDDQLHVTPAA